MTTPTTTNPYLLFGEEPKDWRNHGNVKPWEQHKKDTQAQNEKWWEVHTKDGNYPHQLETPLGIEGSDFPLGQGNRYGPFIYCPFPLEGKVRWAFRRADGFAAFRVDLANDSLPKGGAGKPVSMTSAPVRKAPAKTAAASVETPTPAADIDLSGDLDLTAAAPDPFADLDMGSEPTASAVEADPFADLDMGEPEADSAPAPAPEADDGEPETDEWGVVIEKPKAAAADPFADLV